MKRLVSGEKKVIGSNPDSIFGYFGWPSVARLEDGTLAMACSGFRIKHVCPFGKAVISYSRDEGSTWTAPAPVIDTLLDDRDAGIVPFGNGKCILTSFNNTPAMQRKWNARYDNPEKHALIDAYINTVEAQDWEKYLGSTYKISEDGGYTFGDIHISPITAPHGPCRLNDGSLLYVGRRFSGDDSFDDGSEPFIQVYRLNPDYELEHVSSIENVIHPEKGLLNSCEPHAIQLPSGRIIVHIRVQGGGIFTVYQSISDDGGLTFSKPMQLLSDKGGSPAHLYLHSNGTLVSAYGYREAPYGIRAMFSRDGGDSWDTDYIIDDTGISGDLGYPASMELSDGRMLTVYYENTGNGSVIMQKIWQMP